MPVYSTERRIFFKKMPVFYQVVPAKVARNVWYNIVVIDFSFFEGRIYIAEKFAIPPSGYLERTKKNSFSDSEDSKSFSDSKSIFF